VSAKTRNYDDVLFVVRERREEGISVLQQKFVDSVSPKLAPRQRQMLTALCADREQLAATAVDDFMALLVA
jgi:2-methylcitrate dehydratase